MSNIQSQCVFSMAVEIKDIHFSPTFRKKAEKWVIRIKSSIIKESKKLEYKKVRKLNRLLINSFYNWVVQVYKVAQEGKGKSRGYGKTLKMWNKGRVLNINELKEWRTRAIEVLRGIKTYRPKKLKRIYIPKPDGTERPLSIPTWFDKIIQGLIGSAIECQVESIIESNGLNAFGFRRGFKTAEAIQKLQNYAIAGKHQKLVEFDIAKFYDTIPHDKLMELINQVDQSTLDNIEKMLKTESLDLKGIVTKPEKGTPQGGSISPILANLYAIETIMLPFRKSCKSNLIMYADDGIIVCDKKETPEEVLANLDKTVRVAGLAIKESKTKIINGESFNFCGFEITRGKGIKLKKDMVKKCKKDCMELIKNKAIPTKATIEKGSRMYLDNTPNHKFKTIYPIIDKMLPKIRGVIEYGRDFIKTPMRKQISKMLWDINQALYKRRKTKLPELPIRKRTKSYLYFSPKAKSYYLDTKEWDARDEEKKWNKIEWKLLGKQDGVCPICKVKLDHNQENNIHHLKPISEGGDNSLGNLRLIHKECHNQVHYQQIEKQKALSKIKELIEIRRIEKLAGAQYQKYKQGKAEWVKHLEEFELTQDTIAVSYRTWKPEKIRNQLKKLKLTKIGTQTIDAQNDTIESIIETLATNGIYQIYLKGNPTLTLIERIANQHMERYKQLTSELQRVKLIKKGGSYEKSK